MNVKMFPDPQNEQTNTAAVFPRGTPRLQKKLFSPSRFGVLSLTLKLLSAHCFKSKQSFRYYQSIAQSVLQV